MPDWKGPERLAAEHSEWLDDVAVTADEESGDKWRRIFAAAPGTPVERTDKPGYDRRMHDVDGNNPREK